MDIIADRTIINALNLSLPQLAYLCARFEDEGIQAECSLLPVIDEQAVHDDLRHPLAR